MPSSKRRRWCAHLSPLDRRLTGKIREGKPLPDIIACKAADAGPHVPKNTCGKVVDELDAIAAETDLLQVAPSARLMEKAHSIKYHHWRFDEIQLAR